nr:polyprotein [Iflaviridae sp.]
MKAYNNEYIKKNAFKLYSDIFIEDTIIDSVEECLEEQVQDNFKSGQRINKCTRPKYDYSNVSYNLFLPFNVIKSVNIELKGRIKNILHLFRQIRSNILLNTNYYDSPLSQYLCNIIKRKNILCDIINYNYISCIAESDSAKDVTGEKPRNIDKSGNVTLIETNPDPPIKQPITYVQNYMQNMSSSDCKKKYVDDIDRWIEIYQFEWNKDHAQNQFLVDIDLPKYLLTMDNLNACDRPNTIPFKVNMLGKYDLEIKIQINCQKFQIGQLLCAWYYFPQFDVQFQKRWQLCNLSQTLHDVITANVSNEVTLRIPYQYYASYIRTRDRADMPDSNNMGKLIVTVLNPLTVSNQGASKCFGTVWLRMLNTEFTGTISGNVMSSAQSGVLCQSESVFSNVLGGVVKELATNLIDNNRDNPPDPRAPMMLVPTATHSWSVGTGLREPVHPLRLDGRGQHPYLNNGVDEMDIRYIASKFAYVNTIDVTKDYTAGKLLHSYEASPMMRKDQYTRITDTDSHSLDAYCLPPVAVISNLFNYWRGSLKFRFDLVYSNLGHNARFLIAYIPGVSTTFVPTLAQAKSSSHVIVSLGETQRYEYNIPFISHRPFWSRNYTGNFETEFVQPPSMVYVFLLNPLVPMESVPERMYINVWMSGGDDFEVSVPVQPNIGLSWNSTVLYKSSELIGALEGYYPYYYGNYFRVQSSKSLVARHAATSGAASTFTSTYAKKCTKDKAYYYKLYENDNSPKYKDADGTLKVAQYAIIWKTNEVNDWVLCPVKNEDNAKLLMQYLVMYQKNLYDALPAAYAICLINTTDTTNNTWSNGNCLWEVLSFNPSSYRPRKIGTFESPTGTQLHSDTSLTSTQNGLLLFGERFISLKDLCRRYQLYSSFVPDVSAFIPGQCVVVVPILMQGLDLDVGIPESINEIGNRCRDGHIPIIASGYRVGSGSIRFRLLLPTDAQVAVWVQHRPDRRLRSRSSIPCREIVTAEAIANHSYSSYIQVTNINSVVEFEIPYYVPGPFVMLQQPYLTKTDDSYFYSLGEISIGFICDKKTYKRLSNVLFTLYYSLGDDARFSLFQGFPPMVLLDDISDVTIQRPVLDDYVLVQPEGPIDWIKDKMKSEIKEGASEIVADVTSSVAQVLDSKVEAFQKELESNYGVDILNKPIVRHVLYSIVNIGLNPKIESILWNIVTLIIELGFATFELAQMLVDGLRQLLQHFSKHAPSELNGGVEAATEAILVSSESPYKQDKGDDEVVVGFLTLMWTALCSVLSYKVAAPKDLKSYSKFLTCDMGNVFKTANSFFSLLKNLLNTFKRLFERIVGYMYPAYSAWMHLDDKYDEVKAWCQEVNYLCDTDRLDSILTDNSLIDRVYVAYDRGNTYLLPMSDIMCDKDIKASRVISIIKEQYKRITKLRDDCISMGADSHVRKMPFTIAMYGEPGIGKSSLTFETCKDLLKNEGITTKGSLMCTVNATDKYWSQCSRQPVLLMDDLWAVEVGDMLTQQIALVNCLVSPVPFTPPMAELSDKKMRYNPDIFWYNTNKPFPKFDRVSKHMLWRRRNVLIYARHINFETESKPNCPHCATKKRPQELTAEESHYISDYHHLRFYIYKNVLAENEVYDAQLTYKDLLIKLKEMFADFRVKDKARFEREVKMYAEIRMQDILDNKTPFSDILDDLNNTRTYLRMKVAEEAVRDYYTSEMFKEMIGKMQCYASNFGDYFHYIKKYGICTVIKSKVEAIVCPESDEPTKVSEDDHLDDEIEEIRTTIATDEETFVSVHDINSLSNWIKYCNSFATDGTLEKLQGDTSRIVYNLYKASVITEIMVKEFIATIHIIDEYRILHKLLCFLMSIDLSKFYDYNWFKDSHREWKCRMQKRSKPKKYDNWFMALVDYESYAAAQESYGAYCAHFADCVHMHIKIDEVAWSPDAGWVHEGKQLMLRCPELNERHERQFCLFHIPMFYYGFLRAYLDVNPHLKLFYARQMFDKLPGEYATCSNKFCDLQGWKAACKVILAQLRERMSAACKKIYQLLYDYFPIIMPLLLVCAGIGGAIILGKQDLERMNTITSKQTQPNSWSESIYNLNIGAAPKVNPVFTTCQSDSSHYTAAIEKLKRNFFYITVIYEGKQVIYRCLMIRNRELLILRHYDNEIRSLPSCECYGKPAIYPSNSPAYLHGIPFDYKRCEIKWFKNYVNGVNCFPSNFGILHLPQVFPEGKDITSFIASRRDHEYIQGIGNLYDGVNIHSSLVIRRDSSKPYIVDTKNGLLDSVMMDDVYLYPKHGLGMCGSVLLGPNMLAPIIGLHVAGYGTHPGTGISEILTREMFVEEVFPNTMYSKTIVPNLRDISKTDVDLETALFPYGCVDGKYIQAQSGKTQLIPSPIHGIFPVETEPNPLSPTDYRLPRGSNPLYDGIAHKGKPPLDFDKNILNECAQDLESTILSSVKPIRSKVGVVDLETAICGNPNLEYFECLEFSTSAGFPLSALKTTSCAKGKKWLFDLEEIPGQGYKLNGMHDELKRLIDLGLSMRKSGIKPFTVFVDCLKDTCLPTAKCRIRGKTRIFSISPVQFTIPFKMYCLDFMASYQKARFSAEHAIGIAPQSHEWTQLASLLLKNSKNIVTGDYKNFGPSLMRCCVNKACDIIVKWYSLHGATEEHLKILRIMLSEISDAFYLCKDLIYQTPCGIPSGSPITAPLNSLVNSLYIRYAYRILCGNDFTKFHENVKMITYGDDIIMSVKDELIENFNTETISNVLKQYLITFTDQDKSDNIVRYRTIDTATFLKRNFIPHPTRSGIWLGQLEKISIQNCLNWIHRRGNHHENIKQNCETSLQLSVEWGEQYYNLLKDKIILALQFHNIPFKCQTWSYYDDHFYG